MVKRRVVVSVDFARSPGTVETLEGPVHYHAGDAIVTGVAGERWPVPRDTFFARYRRAEEDRRTAKDGVDGVDGVEGVEGEGAEGPDGAGDRYESLPETAWAVHLDEADLPFRVVTPAGAVLQAARGDWVVERQPGDVHVVNGELFSSLYEECD